MWANDLARDLPGACCVVVGPYPGRVSRGCRASEELAPAGAWKSGTPGSQRRGRVCSHDDNVRSGSHKCYGGNAWKTQPLAQKGILEGGRGCQGPRLNMERTRPQKAGGSCSHPRRAPHLSRTFTERPLHSWSCLSSDRLKSKQAQRCHLVSCAAWGEGTRAECVCVGGGGDGGADQGTERPPSPGTPLQPEEAVSLWPGHSAHCWPLPPAPLSSPVAGSSCLLLSTSQALHLPSARSQGLVRARPHLPLAPGGYDPTVVR